MKSMPNVDSQIMIRHSQSDIFALSQDHLLRMEWDPFIKKIELLDNATKLAKGVILKITTQNDRSMSMKYIFFHSPKSVALQMTEGPKYYSKFVGSWKFEEMSDALTKVSFRYNYELKWWWLRLFLGRSINRRLQQSIDDRLKQLKQVAENTDIIDRIDGKEDMIEWDDEAKPIG